jgi:F0F1-type ATP synthase delta subunit
MPVEYAHALSQSLESITHNTGAESRVDALVVLLKKEGKMRALPAILRELERLEARKSSQKPMLAVSKESDLQSAFEELRGYLSTTPEIATKIDERLIGGWRYTDRDTRIDASYKTALLELYRRVTTL